VDSEEVGCEWLWLSCTSRVIVGLVAYQVQEDKVGFRFKGITLVLAFLAFKQAFL